MSTVEMRAYKAAVAICALAWVMLLSFLAAPHVQARVSPVHVNLAVHDVVRSVDRLCWDYSSTKVREGATDDLDVFLYVEGHDRLVVAPYGASDGLPWRRSAAPAVGPVSKRWCIDLADGLPDTGPIRFELTAYYAGPYGLWRVPLHWPPVVAGPLTNTSALPR